MREQRAVAEADEGVDDRPGVHDDVNPLVRDTEEPVRLDQLETLVGKRRGVHADLSSHRPGRMGEGLVDGDGRELFGRSPAERPARCGEHESVDGLRCAALQALEEGGVLAVDRQQEASALAMRRHGELTGRDEALLVGEGQCDAVLE